MDTRTTFKGASAEDAWQRFSTDITWQESPNNYRAIIHTGKHDIFLETVRSPSGGEEGWGFGQTTFRAPLPANNTFKFAIVPEDIFNRIGKLFGMQDVKVGFPEFDESVLVHTNDEQKLRTIFQDSFLREVFQNMSGYSLHIDKADDAEGDHLHLVVQHALTEQNEMQRVFTAFNMVLNKLS